VFETADRGWRGIGMIPGTVLYVYLGSTAKDLAQVFSGGIEGGVAQQAFKVAGLLATVAVTVYITRVARRELSHAVPLPEKESET
jgi:uncharacterized membrane protein YdjX (TVP38/TMEM64 family)